MQTYLTFYFFCKNAITKIQSNGFYINENIIKLALKQAGEL